jgi:hypothetical protein
MSWQTPLKGDSLTWLLESDNPGVRYLALRDLCDLPPEAPELLAARESAHTRGPISKVLAEMQPEGYWAEPGPGYNPKYFSTVWSLILLAQLGAVASLDERIQRAMDYFLKHGLTQSGQITTSGAPSGTADCMQGNLCWALTELGRNDSRIETAFDWMARSVTGEGIAPMNERDAPVRYYAGKCGPLFACGANDKQSCAWGAAKVMLALARCPVERRTPQIARAIQQGVDFLFSVEPDTAGWPSPYAAKPSGNWWKFGFPVFYITDLLQIVEALVALGYGRDPRLANALQLILEKQDANGRWPLEYDYTGKTWGDFGEKKQPNPWVTLRVLRVLKKSACQRLPELQSKLFC